MVILQERLDAFNEVPQVSPSGSQCSYQLRIANSSRDGLPVRNDSWDEASFASQDVAISRAISFIQESMNRYKEGHLDRRFEERDVEIETFSNGEKISSENLNDAIIR